MEKYRLVQEHKGDGDEFLESTNNCEVRITQQGKPRNYISFAMGLFVSVTMNLLRFLHCGADRHLFLCRLMVTIRLF